LCDKWNTLSEQEKEQYSETAERHNITLFNAFLKEELTPRLWKCKLSKIDGQVLYLAMVEGEGNVAKDFSGFNNDGIIYGATWEKDEKKIYLSFDGVDDYIDCGNPPSLSPTEAITLMAWIKREEVNDYGMVIGKGSSYLLGYYNNNRIFFNFYNGTSWLTNIYSNTVITHQEWHHIAATYDKNQAKVKIYINGELDKEASVTPYNIYQSTYSVYIGYMQGWSQWWHLQGKIALAAIFNRALTDEEIAKIYETTRKYFE